MNRMRISKKTVDALTSAQKDRFLWDGELAGFGVKITPTGRKVYLVQYRIGGRKGRCRRVTLGQHGPLTADQARDEARRLLGEVAIGRDPAAAREQRRLGLTVGQALGRFMDEHVDAKLRRSTGGEYRRLARLYVLPRFATRQLAEITRSDVCRLHSDLRDKPYQANRTLALLSKFFNWAEKHGYRPDHSNPCRHVEKYGENERERFLRSLEVTRLHEAMQAAEEAKTATPWAICALYLLMYTGARLSEILKLRWEWVDWQHRLLLLPTSKTGKKSIVLSEPALAILRRVPRVEGNPYVICGEKPGAHMVNLQKTWRRIRMAAGLPDVRIHDLRHSFASFAAAGGASLPMIGALLGHAQAQTTMRYAHLANDPLAEVAEAVGRQIERAANSRTYDGGSGGRGCKIDSPTVDHLPPDRERNRSTVEVGRLTAPIVAVIEGESRSTSGNT